MLAQKLALVTGAGSGIGRAICQTFAKNGATVVCADITQGSAETTRSTLTKSDEPHFAVQADVSSSDFVNQLVSIISRQYQRPPDIVVNSAGITQDSMLNKMSESQWDWVLAVNLKGPFLVTQAFSNTMKAAQLKTGSIINISSIIGKVGNIGQTNYAASKAGLIGMTKTVAKELGRHNIRCNAVLPGFIETPMTAKVPVDILNGLKAQIPLGRMGQPEDIADVCLFLASDLSRYVTGATVDVTGGLFM